MIDKETMDKALTHVKNGGKLSVFARDLCIKYGELYVSFRKTHGDVFDFKRKRNIDHKEREFSKEILEKAKYALVHGIKLAAFAKDYNLNYQRLHVIFVKECGSPKYYFNNLDAIQSNISEPVEPTESELQKLDGIINEIKERLINLERLGDFIGEYDISVSEVISRIENIRNGYYLPSLEKARDEAFELKEIGLLHEDIADKINVPLVIVSKWLNHKGDLNSARLSDGRSRSGHNTHKYAENKLRQFLKLYGEGKKMRDIAKILGVTHQAIHQFLSKYGYNRNVLSELYPSEIAIKNAEKEEKVAEDKIKRTGLLLAMSKDWQDGMTCKDLAEKYGLSGESHAASKITWLRDRYGEEFFHRRLIQSTEEELTLISEMLQGGSSINEILEKVDRDKATLHQMIYKYRNERGEDEFPRPKGSKPHRKLEYNLGEVKQWWDLGVKIKDIAKFLDRSEASAYNLIAKLRKEHGDEMFPKRSTSKEVGERIKKAEKLEELEQKMGEIEQEIKELEQGQEEH